MSQKELYAIILRALSSGRSAMDNVILDRKDAARANLKDLNNDLHDALTRLDNAPKPVIPTAHAVLARLSNEKAPESTGA